MHSERRILITDNVHPLLCEGLEDGGFTVDYQPNVTSEVVNDVIGDYEGLIINSNVYAGKQLLDKANKLKFVCRLGSGLEVIDVEYAKKKGVAAFNSPEGNRNAVAEHALGMLLNLFNHITKANNEVKSKLWKREENRGVELSGKAVGLIAYGNTAEALAKLLSSFGVKVLAYDKYKTGFSDSYVRESSLTAIFEEADVVSLHLPLTPETEYMIDNAFLSSFKKNYWLINTSRGRVLQTEALLQNLENGKIMGAALDVLENEKLETMSAEQKKIFEKLIQHPNILLTPHIAGWTYESKQKIAETLLQKIRKLYAKE